MEFVLDFFIQNQGKKRVKNMIQEGTMARIPSIQMSKKKLTDYFLANELHCSWRKLVFLGEIIVGCTPSR